MRLAELLHELLGERQLQNLGRRSEREPRRTADSQPNPPPANHDARSIAECGSL
jgi:hypothetical protein